MLEELNSRHKPTTFVRTTFNFSAPYQPFYRELTSIVSLFWNQFPKLSVLKRIEGKQQARELDWEINWF